MFGLNPATDLSPLTGSTLSFVGFGEHQLQLAFSGQMPCAISVEGDYLVTPPGLVPTLFGNAVDGASVLLRLLGHTVTHASVPADGTTRLAFSDGSIVEVVDSSAHYESYQINLGDQLLVV